VSQHAGPRLFVRPAALEMHLLDTKRSQNSVEGENRTGFLQHHIGAALAIIPFKERVTDAYYAHW
jgi:hypothetical protein